MTEPGPFTPPGAAVPPAAPAPTAPVPTAPPPAATLPAPTGAPIGAVPMASAPPPQRRRRWIVPVIVGGSLALVGLIAGVAFLAVQLATAVSQTAFSPTGGDPDALHEGEPGSPVAVDPLDCGACFTIDDARSIELPADVYAQIGLPHSDDESYEIVAGRDQTDTTEWWESDGGTPDHCYFTYTSAPLFFAPGDSGDPSADDDLVYYPDWHLDSSQYYSFTEAVRVFDESASATTHLAEVKAAIDGCSTFSYTETGWHALVSAAPALDLPDDVAAYGWVENAGLKRYYGVDLQRGNLVARLSLSSDPDGPTEAEFRDVVEAYAVLLGELEPAS
jgi:hypothetical protein